MRTDQKDSKTYVTYLAAKCSHMYAKQKDKKNNAVEEIFVGYDTANQSNFVLSE